MTLDDLGKESRAINEAAASKEQREQLIAVTRHSVNRLWRQIFRRDFAETIAAVFVIAFFGRYCQVAPAEHVISKIGAGFLMCWALFVIYRLHRTRTIQQPSSQDAPVREFCRIALGRLDRQIQLLHGVLWWYVAPCIIGADVMFIGLAGWGIASVIYFLATLLLAWGIHTLNLRAVMHCLEHPRNELAALLSQLDNAAMERSQ